MIKKGDITGLRYKNINRTPREVGPPKKIPRHRPIELPIVQEKLEGDLEKYRKMALEFGAEDSKIISAKQIPQDPRVWIKCAAPQCGAYGSSSMCPPHFKLTLQEAKEIVQAYDWAVVFKVKEDPNQITGPNGLSASSESIRYMANISDAIEGEAYYDGHVYAIGLTGGPCKVVNCEKFPNCAHMKIGVCRFPTRAKPSSSGFLIDHFKLIERLGWKTTLAGYCIWPEDVKRPLYSIGIVLIE